MAMQHGAKMENLAKFPQATLARCPVLCGQMCHHCDTCLWFSHRLISPPRGSGHPGRHQLGLNSGGKTRPPHLEWGQGRRQFLQVSPTSSQNSWLISTPSWDICALSLFCWQVSSEDRRSSGLDLWFCFLLLFHRNKRKPEEKTTRSF